MAQATIFTNNKSQAVRIPKVLAFPESDKKLGRKRPSFLEQTQLPVILLTLIHNL